MDRFQQLRTILESGHYFKVVCGAGNEDPEEVFRLSLVYTLAGALGIDVSANAEVVRASVRGVETAQEWAAKLGFPLAARPFINVSVGLKGDPHVRKAKIDEAICVRCGACEIACLQKAIIKSTVQAHRCIGCGACASACPVHAISFFTRKVDFSRILPECMAAGAETLELHAIVPDDEAVRADWQQVNDACPGNFVSMCIDRSHLSNTHLERRIRQAREIAGERLVIQADGAPMSGGEDDYRTTLQAVAIAEEISKFGIPAMILLSGGTNSKTGELAKLCGLKVNGVSIGTFARKILRSWIEKDDLATNREVLVPALEKARWLVSSTISCISR